MITVLCGGVGAARFLSGLVAVHPARDVTAVVNVADDLVLHGLHISPDIDTVTYTLADAIDTTTGWGLRNESWVAMESLERYGGQTWFRLGDRDLATHLYRTQRLSEGAPLSQITAEITRAWGLECTVVPVTDDPVRTRLTVGAEEIDFQEYFVHRRHAVPVSSVRFVGAETARPAPGVIEAVMSCDTLVIAPSNPIVSIGPLLAVPAVHDALVARRDTTVAIAPIVAGAALKGPADRLLDELGHEPSVVGVAHLYRDVVGTLIIDEADRSLAPAVEAEGVACVVAPTVMRGPAEAASLARTTLEVR